MNKDAVPGGAFDAGPLFGARTADWGIEVLSGESLCIDVTDVAPRSLTAGLTGLDPNPVLDFEASPRMPTSSATCSRSGWRSASTSKARDLLELQRAMVPIEHD